MKVASQLRLAIGVLIALLAGILAASLYVPAQLERSTNDKYLEDAVALFTSTGLTTVFVNLEDFPEDWQGNVPAWQKYFRDHQCPSFLEYGEYPGVTAEEIKKALKLKAAFSDMLDQMQ